MEIKAQLNYLHIAPRKVRLVASLLKGMDVPRAELELRELPKRTSLPLLKLLKSAVANAQNNFHLERKGLYIKDIQVNEGPKLKRFRPRAFGRAATIRKRTSHISVVLDTRGPAKPSQKQLKRAAPVVREASSEDVKGEIVRSKKEYPEETKVKSQKSTGFARKVFRRKVI